MRCVESFVSKCVESGYISCNKAPWLTYALEKRISSMKITLANGRTLADLKVQVDENTGKRVLTGTKTGATYMEPSVIQSNGMLRFEMDSELIQGSQIQLTYEIVIRKV